MSVSEEQKGKVLVAEDEPDIAQIVKFLLESKGYDVVLCPNGEDALKKIPDIKPDLLILDVMMPKMSGFALVKELKKDEEYASIPVLMVSGISKGSDKTDDYWKKGMGVDDYITKPFDPKDLVQRVENLLRKKREGWLEKERNGTLEQVTAGSGMVSVKEQPSSSKTATQVSRPSKKVERDLSKPEEIVRTFVESWNTQDFDLEYSCLSSRLAYTNQTEYVQRRRGYYAQTNSSEPHRQLVKKIISTKTSGNNAQVDIIRLDTEGKRERTTQETYILIQENNQWKINAVKAGQ